MYYLFVFVLLNGIVTNVRCARARFYDHYGNNRNELIVDPVYISFVITANTQVDMSTV